jgi:ABC-type antimicrobial peptide transport system permease subunit
MDRISESRWRETEFLYQLLAGVSAVALILSLTTIYSVMSFTVSRRTREIGVRVALGAHRRRVVLSILRRPLAHVTGGIALGATLVSLVTLGLTGPLTAAEAGTVVFYSAAMLGVCLLASIVPTRRALAVQPTEALRAEA